MKNILLIGHVGFYNRGCEAIVRGTVEIIKRFLPESRITLVSGAPDLDSKAILESGLAVDQVVPAQLSGYTKPSPRWIWQTIDRRLLSGNIQFQDYLHRSYFEEADLVMSIGGDNFSEDYGSPECFFESLRYAKQLGKKTVIWGASVGPFKHEVNRWATILQSCDLITAREDNTVAYLQTLGCKDNVRRVSDPAFCMPAKKPIEASVSRETGRLTVGLGISDLIPKYGIPRAQYSKLIAEFICHLRRSYDAHVILVPHVIQLGKDYVDDLRACNEVMDALPEGECCQMLPGHLDATEFKYCIAQCDCFIGARTHSTIASLSSQVPTGSIGYSVKATGINLDLLGTTDYVLPHTQLSADKLRELFESMKTNRDRIVEKLHVEAPRAQQRALRAGDFLASITR